MNDRYAYLIGALFLSAVLVVVLLTRRDLRMPALKVGMLGGLAGIVGEVFYYRDYWHPPAVLGTGSFLYEDFIFSFAITALSFAAYPVFFRYAFGPRATYRRRHRLYLAFFVFGMGGMLVSIFFPINTIFVSAALFILFGAIMLASRRDLLVPSLCATAVLLLVVLFSYIVFFDILFPEFWQHYWLLAGTRSGLVVFGNIPATEILWYISWMFFAGISYPFVSGRPFVRIDARSTGE